MLSSLKVVLEPMGVMQEFRFFQFLSPWDLPVLDSFEYKEIKNFTMNFGPQHPFAAHGCFALSFVN